MSNFLYLLQSTSKSSSKMQRVSGRFFIYVAAAFLLLPGWLFANTAPANIDSLKNMLTQTRNGDRIKTYVELVKNLRNIDPAAGIHYAKEAYKMPDIASYELLMAQLINEEGVCYRKLNLPEKALELHFVALKVFEQKNDSMGIAFSLANIGNVYQQIGEFEKALDHHFKSLFLKEHLKDDSQVAYSQNSIGLVLLDMKEYRRALDFFISAMAIHKKNNDLLRLADVYASIGKVMTALNRFDDAQQYLEQSLAFHDKTGNLYSKASVLNQMANLLFIQKKYIKALQYLEEAENIGLSINSKGILHNNFKLQKDIYKLLNKPEKALYYADETSRLRDSLFSERRYHEITELQVKYETQKLDSQNEILRLRLVENDYRLKYVIAGAFILLLSVIVLVFINRLMVNYKNKKNLERLNLELETRVDERTEQLYREIKEKQDTYNILKESQQHLKGIYDTSPFGIAVTNTDGRIIHTNRRLTESTGIPAKEFLDSTWLRHILNEDRKKVEMTWQNAHKSGEAVADLNFRIRNEKLVRWIRLKAAPLNNDGEFTGLVVVMENITETKKFESDLIKAKNKAEESDHLKSAFLANMSHEIRTPMNAILGFSDLLASDEYENDEKKEFVEMIRSSGKVLLNLINDIIDISKIEAGELKIQNTEFNLKELLDTLFFTFRQQLNLCQKHDIRLILNAGDETDQPLIQSDKMRLNQIFTNLLSNALKFTQHGEIEFGVIPIGDNYQFFVKDSGIGIPEEKLDVIFQRFRQADDSHTRLFGGTGLGLAITKNLTQLLGGTIWVESVVGKGSAFYFTLPAPATSHINEPHFLNLENKIILVAEDVETNFTLIQRMFRSTNATILHASSGLIAVDMALAHKPDLILMDIQMPEKDGIEAMKEIKKAEPRQQIIAVSAFSLTEDGDKYIRMGFDSYLSKPISTGKLIEASRIFLNS